jgi:uncharacterized protein
VRVGIVADTHGLLRPELPSAFEGVEHVVHGGDVGSVGVLDGLAAIAPVTAVCGNVDGAELRERLPEVARVELAGVRVLVVHGHQVGSPTPERLVAAYPDADLLVFGHSHRPLVRRVGAVLAVNPGSAGRRRFRDPVGVALAELRNGDATAWLVDLGAVAAGSRA